MNKTNTSGPAFPNVAFGSTRNEQQGMTLRDYFAAKAMSAIVTCGDDVADDIARKAYIIAEAMLKAREE